MNTTKTIKLRRDIINLDLNQIPNGWNIDKLLDIYNATGILFFDSSLPKGNSFPKKICVTREIILSDLATEEGQEHLKAVNRIKKYNKNKEDEYYE